MILIDFINRTCCTILGFWIFDLPTVPIQNYIGWFAIGILLKFFQFKIIEKEFTFSTHLLIVNAIFFAFLNYQII